MAGARMREAVGKVSLEEIVRWACAHSPVGCTDAGTARVEVRVA